MKACDSLLRIYGPQEGIVAFLRQKGLDFINSTPLAKKQIVSYAMGL